MTCRTRYTKILSNHVIYLIKQIKKISVSINIIKVVSICILLKGSYCDLAKIFRDHDSIIRINDHKFNKKLDTIDDVSDWKDQQNRSIFHILVLHKQVEKIKMILYRFNERKNLGFKHKNEDLMDIPDPISGHTPLGECIRANTIIQKNIQVFNALIENPYVDCNRISGTTSPLILIFQYGSKAMARSLLAKSNVDIFCREPHTGSTILHCAIQRASHILKGSNSWSKIAANDVVSLMKKKAPHLLYAQDVDGNTPLHLAAKTLVGHVSLIIDVLCKSLTHEQRCIKNHKGKTAYDLFIKGSDQRNLFKSYFTSVLD